jgi:glycerol-3-phosphate acyltransferase PlsX
MNFPRIAIDAMGGDEGVRVMVAGAALAADRYPQVRFLLVGDQSGIERALDRHSALRPLVEILHADDVISGEDKPSQALRRARTTSMGMAIHAVKMVRRAQP